MKNFIKYLNKNHVTITSFQILFCTCIYLLRENIPVSPQTIAYVNLAAACVLIILLYHAVHKNIFRWGYILCTLTAIFVFNRFYDKTEFFAVFQIELRYFLIVTACISGIVIMYPYIRRTIQFLCEKLSGFLDRWTFDREQEESDRKTRDKVKERSKRSQSVQKPDTSNQDKQEEAIQTNTDGLSKKANQNKPLGQPEQIVESVPKFV